MTRKEALTKTVAYLKEQRDPLLQEVIAELEGLIQCLPITEWDEKTILDAVEQFRLERGRYPFPNEFCGYTLPSHSVVRRRLGLSPTQLIAQYASNEGEQWQRTLRRYGEKPATCWLQQFQETIRQHPEVTSRTYNQYRLPDTPCLKSLFKIMQVATWNELLVLAGLPVKKHEQARSAMANKQGFLIVRRTEAENLDEIEQIYEKLLRSIGDVNE